MMVMMMRMCATLLAFLGGEGQFPEKMVGAGLEIRGILVANATMFSLLLPGFSCSSKHLLLP